MKETIMVANPSAILPIAILVISTEKELPCLALLKREATK